mgnify:CR=1 FL=1
MKIKMLVMDVDGTLTDGKIYMGSDGEVFKAFDVKDGYAIAHLHEVGIIPVIITGRESKIVENRGKELNIKEVYQGVSDKVEKLKEVAKDNGVLLEEVAYIGDDLNDLDCMGICGLSACPNDAIDEVINKVDFKCNQNGGYGAVREFIEYISSCENL